MLARLLSGLIGTGKKKPAVPAQAAHAAPGPWLEHGRALERAGQMSAAIDCFEACVEAHPQELNARLALANALAGVWRVEESLEHFTQAVQLPPHYPEILSNYLLWQHLAARPQPQALSALHRRYGAAMSASVTPRYEARHRGTPDPERRLRIGYVSRNFLRHSVAFFIEPVIAQHDRRRYEVYCYYTHQVIDETTQRIERLADVWRHVEGDDDDALAAKINDDAIDILVDLGGHTKLNRLGVFARKPAPVQMTWIGYPDTTGLAAIDYRITDAIADPGPEADALHTERLLRLDAPFLAYQPPLDSPAVTPREGEAVTFGSFNMLAKLNDPTVALWARILDAVPDSRLVLKSSALKHVETATRVRERFGAQGIAPGRIELRDWAADRGEHLAAYGALDIALDTHPYNGTTTTCEALWMGVPVVTLAGEMHMSRVGATLLSSVGLAELVAQSAGDYVAIAVALAHDVARRRALRAGLRQRLAGSPLLDHARFTAGLERELREAWRRWCRDQEPV